MLSTTGEIKDLTVAWLFQELASANKTGTAVFEQDLLVRKVFFSNGDILFASSNMDDDQLGQFLVRQGRMTREQFETASAAVRKTNKQLGAVLFELNILGPKDLVAQVKLQVKHIILGLFSWRDGKYRFEEGPPASGEDIVPLQMATPEIILEGLQALDWQVVRKGLPPTKTVLRPTTDPSVLFQNAPLSPDQKAVLWLIDGARTVELLCSQSGIGDFNALKAVYLLLGLKLVEPGTLKTHAERASAGEAPGQTPDAPPEPPVTRDMIQQAFEAMQGQNHFQVLGVNATTTTAELKKTYFRLAKRYHPDRHLEPEMADLKDLLEALFARISDAYQTLSNEDKRREYEKPSAKTVAATSQYEEKRAEDYVENYAEKTKSAVAYFNAGMKEFSQGNFWGAADSFAWATRLDPVKAPYFFQYGLSLVRIPRRRHEAEENLQKAIEIDPLKPEYHLELGNLYLKSGLKSKALDVFTVALRDNPGSEKLQEAFKASGGTVAPAATEPDSAGVFKKMFKDKK